MMPTALMDALRSLARRHHYTDPAKIIAANEPREPSRYVPYWSKS